MKTGVSDFVWYELMTNDMDGAIAFYSKVVGWDIRDSGMPNIPYMIFSMDGKDVGGIMSWKSMGMDMPTEWAAHLYAADVDKETAAVLADGGTEVQPPRDIPGVGRFAVVLDPQGAKYMLFQPNQTYAPPRLGQNDLGSIGWHELMTSDDKAAWDFYSRHYGWQKDFAMDMGDLGTYQTFIASSDRYTGAIMPIPPFVPDKTPRWKYYITIADIQSAARAVTDNGGTITMPPMQVPGGSWVLNAIDPQGGIFALTTPQTGTPQQP
jgi:predicted enzyme related to lactoylglutathione lyase